MAAPESEIQEPDLPGGGTFPEPGPEPAIEYDDATLQGMAVLLVNNPAGVKAFGEARDGLMRRAFATELGEPEKREHLYLLAQSCRELEATLGRMARTHRHGAELQRRLHPN
jgi:hypothetical protein